jgi:DNA-binding MarR family transcriptional regulator
VAKAKPKDRGPKTKEARAVGRVVLAATSPQSAAPERLDRLIHERIRLGMISALAVNEELTFNELKSLLRTTDGNLSVHSRKLEQAGYVSCEKAFEGRIPKTSFRITGAGRRALDRYLGHMEALIHSARRG